MEDSKNILDKRNNNSLNLYKITEKEKTLQFEIESAEMQLKHVNHRLHQLSVDIKIFAGILISPIPLYLLYSILANLLFSPFKTDIALLGLLMSISTLLAVIYVFLFPVMFYNLLKSIFLYQEHHKDYSNQQSMEVRAQSGKYEPKKGVAPPERNYQCELTKLNWVLCRYYLYKDSFNKLKERMDLGEDVSTAEVDQAIDAVVFYDKITPANPFTGEALKRAKRISLIVILLLLTAILLYIFM